MHRRTIALIGEERYKKIAASKVAVIGVGGVGGYVAEMIARCGVGDITLVDGDAVDISNLNRQIIALVSSVGRSKVDVAKERIADINPNIKVTAVAERISEENIEYILSGKYDYIIDAIDSVNDKVALIKFAKSKNFNIISSMGAGNRYKDCVYAVADIYNTKYDPLAKKMRGLMRKEGIEELEVCYSETPAEPIVGGFIGSISYTPAMCGITIAAHVIRRIIGE